MNKNMNKRLFGENLLYSIYNDSNGNKKIATAKNIDSLNYRTMKSAYNPDYALTNKIIRVKESDLYPTTRNHTKDIIIVDGDDESVAGYALSKNKKRNKNTNNIVLDSNQLLISKDKKPQYIEKKIRTKENSKEKLMKSSGDKNRNIISIPLTQSHIEIIKSVSMLQTNVNASINYRKKKELNLKFFFMT